MKKMREKKWKLVKREKKERKFLSGREKVFKREKFKLGKKREISGKLESQIPLPCQEHSIPQIFSHLHNKISQTSK